MATVLIGIGSNLGDRRENVRRGLALLADMPDIDVVNRSRLYSSKPVGGPRAQGDYVNAAAVLQTSLAPHALLEALQHVEAQLGRTREGRWGPRTLDLDLLLFDEQMIEDEVLTLPHPRMSFRRFVLEPAAEVAPEMVHPVCGWRIEELLARLDKGPHYVAIGGLSLWDRTWLAKRIGFVLDCPVLIGEKQYLPLTTGLKTSHPLVRFLESIGRYAGAVDHARWSIDPRLQPLLDTSSVSAEDASSTPPAVSNFWFEDWRLWACLYGAHKIATSMPRDYDQLLQQLTELSQTAVAPKLVIWLDVDAAQTPPMEERWSACLAGLFQQAPCGALLRIDRSDRDWMLTESLMAIKAMKPLEGVVL